MSVPEPTIVLPEAQVGQWTAFNTGTATGLFAYRQSQALGLLDLPDFGGGDLTDEQRKEALKSAVSFHQPLAALSLFLGVVALEDFIRDLIARLINTPVCLEYFPLLESLRAIPKELPPEKMFQQPINDPAGQIDPEKLNGLLQRTIGVSPIPAEEWWHLRDLIVIRHTVAHHAAVIRQVDVQRFRYFVVTPERLINPPSEFVRAELLYLFRIGRTVEIGVRNAIFSKLISVLGKGWSSRVTSEIFELIELFSFFGYVETTTVPVGYSEPGSALRARQEQESQRIRRVLLDKCLTDLVNQFGD